MSKKKEKKTHWLLSWCSSPSPGLFLSGWTQHHSDIQVGNDSDASRCYCGGVNQILFFFEHVSYSKSNKKKK